MYNTRRMTEKNYDTAIASGAVLVTGNKKHYPEEPIILSPTEFLESVKS